MQLAGHVLALARFAPGQAVAGFWPLPGEIDIRPLLLALAGRGCTMCLPVTPERGSALTFRRWAPGMPMATGPFGTAEPVGPSVTPTVVLVPLLAFDRQGHRLGYGAGYYDRTLSLLSGIRTIGCAFSAQEVAAVPAGPTDIPLHAIATERGLFRTSHAHPLSR
jgi:5-formyltetrahydrofolate cyclo-ligase